MQYVESDLKWSKECRRSWLAHELENDVRIHPVHGWASSQVPNATKIELYPLTACNTLCHVDVVHWELKRVIQEAAPKQRDWAVLFL